MSHSTVLVIGEDPEKMLAPYDEGLEVEPYRKYEDVDKPQDHWMFKILVENHGLAADPDWPSFVAAHNERYSEDPMYHDAELDRAYSMSTYNPLSRWDWYLLGGRWTGYFKLKAGETGEPGIMTPGAKVGWADQARKCDIDFEGMRATAGAEAADLHAKASRVLAGLPPLIAWTKVREEMFPGDIDAARRFYHDQPGIQALNKAELRFDDFDDPATYLCLDQPSPAAVYVERRRAGAGLTFAVLDGQGWHERGRMGWFGVVHEESDDWASVGWAIINAAPDDALFSVYDVHI